MLNDPETPSLSDEKTEPRPSSSAPSRLDLTPLELPSDQFIEVTKIRAQASAVAQAFFLLGLTVVVAAVAMVIVEVSGHSVDALREMFLAIGTGEIGLIAGLQRGG